MKGEEPMEGVPAPQGRHLREQFVAGTLRDARRTARRIMRRHGLGRKSRLEASADGDYTDVVALVVGPAHFACTLDLWPDEGWAYLAYRVEARKRTKTP